MKSIVVFCFVLISFFSQANEIENESCHYTIRDSVAVYAQEQLGTPYVYGGVSKKGFDCSGFVLFVYQKFGIALPHSSKSMANLGKETSRTEAKTGDLIIFKGRNSN